MTTDTATKITVLKHLANGRDFGFAAVATGLTDAHIRDIATMHGYPKPDSMRKAIAVLERNLDADSDLTTKSPADTDPGQRIGRPAQTPTTTTRPARTAASTATAEPADPPTAPLTAPDEIRVLLNTAKASPSKQIQRLADKVLEDVARLRDRIHLEQVRAEEANRVQADRERARAEVARLEQQLQAAKAKLTGKTTTRRTATTTGSGPSAAVIRTWARANGHDVPVRGVLPRAVRDAYNAAHAGTDTAA